MPRTNTTATLSPNGTPRPRGPLRHQVPMPDFADFENDEYLSECREKEIVERLRREKEQAKQRQLIDGAGLPRREARAGEICNPWLDHGGYCPLLDWVAAETALTAGDKILHAAILRRIRICCGRLPVDKLAEETAASPWKVYERIRKFMRLNLIARSRFDKSRRIRNLYLLGPDDKPLLDDSRSEAMEKLLAYESRIPVELMRTREITDLETLVYARLAGLAGEKGRWFGSNDKLAEACGCTLLTLRKAIRGLEQEKLIRVDRQAVRSRYRPGGGWNQYFFLGHHLFRKPRTAEKWGYRNTKSLGV